MPLPRYSLVRKAAGSMVEILTFIGIAVITIGVAFFVLSPIMLGVPDTEEQERYSRDQVQVTDDRQVREAQELQLDHAMGKVSSEDIEPVSDADAEEQLHAEADVEELIARAKQPRWIVCPECAVENPREAKICSSCGAEIS